jgi:hypothetical protein
MYPFAMANFKHPVQMPTLSSKHITADTYFLTVTGKNYGAACKRTKEGLRFDIDRGTFGMSIYEFNTAVSHGLFIPEKIEQCYNFRNSTNFEKFVTEFFNKRKQAKDNKDNIHSLFYKLLLNSSYGKLAMDSSRFKDYTLTDSSTNLSAKNYSPSIVPLSESKHGIYSAEDYILWERPVKMNRFYNVATAASITGAARSILLDGIARAKNPIYCDTDSIICEGMDGVKISDSELGAWKLEAEGDTCYIAGKKMYALFNGKQCVKHASKGVRLTPDEIIKITQGAIIEDTRDAPSYNASGSYQFIKRRARMTGRAELQ